MAHTALKLAFVCALAGCAPASGTRVESATIARSDAPPALRGDVAGFVPRRSSRLHASVPLPDGAAWLVDDRSSPDFIAEHEATHSVLTVRVSVERELVNRARCEALARERGFVPRTALRTVESGVAEGTHDLDTGVVVAIEPGASDDAPTTGYVFAFAAQLRKCLFFRYETKVSSSRDGDELSSRLALVRTRVVPGIVLEPVLDAAPREVSAPPRHRGQP